MGDKVWIEDVTGRDGLQNEPKPVPTDQKLALIRKIAAAGLSRIQATSFVHPRWVPQLADAEELAKHLFEIPGVRFSALIPNLKGYERAVAAGFRHLEFVIAASDTFNHKNLNRGTKESLELLRQVTERALHDGVEIRVGFSNSFNCPFEGVISAPALVQVVRAAREIHPWPVGIADTDGKALPTQVREAVRLLQKEVMPDLKDLGLHVHDTYGRGLANVLAGLDLGVRNFDSTTGGLGGCPYCPGASGNLATEDLVAFLEGMGYETGVDMEKLLDAAELAITFSSRTYQGHLLRAMRPNTPNAACFAAK
ncbi:MAG: hydroxymethylglutaryl-CoA lyase [Candidatus Acidiferrales bacterium]